MKKLCLRVKYSLTFHLNIREQVKQKITKKVVTYLWNIKYEIYAHKSECFGLDNEFINITKMTSSIANETWK